ncbi:hypothetical protein HAX54_014582, partial [Datura stramonium]|nr:hypothetical protein [Datura stramonium]
PTIFIAPTIPLFDKGFDEELEVEDFWTHKSAAGDKGMRKATRVEEEDTSRRKRNI